MLYVDPLFSTLPSKRWPYNAACHLTADTVEELHSFAVSTLGLRREWFQGHHSNPVFWHYDLTASKRTQAIRAGALSLSGEQWLERVRNARVSPLP